MKLIRLHSPTSKVQHSTYRVQRREVVIGGLNLDYTSEAVQSCKIIEVEPFRLQVDTLAIETEVGGRVICRKKQVFTKWIKIHGAWRLLKRKTINL